MLKEDRRKCPRCKHTGSADEFGKLNNEDQLHCLDVIRCPDCGHIFAPIPPQLQQVYLERLLGVKPV